MMRPTMKTFKISLLFFLLLSAPLFSNDMLDSGASGDTNKQLNLMWRTFGHGEGVELAKFGNSPAYFEWMALKHCWSDTPKYRALLRRKLVDWAMANDGYVWTWKTEEGWPTHHVRHNENNAKYILAVYRYYCWQGGKAFLNQQDKTKDISTQKGQTDISNGMTVLEKTRKAMAYQLNTLQGKNGLAIITDPKCDGTVNGMPSDYWDNFRFGYKSAYTNIYFYASLIAMAKLERSLGQQERAEALLELSRVLKVRFHEDFWDKKKGRFIGCIDIEKKKWDFGFTYLNLEAIAYGLATKKQSEDIFAWLDGKRIIASDKQKVDGRLTGATGSEIYHLNWAPVSTTRAVESIKVDGKHWWWHLNNKINVSGPKANAIYGEHLENGGAIFYVSYYDILARLKTMDTDHAWTRVSAILDEFRQDRLNRKPKNFKGARWKWGIIKVFPESGLVPASMAITFMGLDASTESLIVDPKLPSALPWLEIKHVSYRGGIYKVKASKESITVKTVKAGPKNSKFTYNKTMKLFAPEGKEITVTR